jgi:hypothetical protein
MADPLEKKVTPPPVAGLPLAVTVAEKVTLDPKAGLVEDALSAVVVGSGATVTRMAFETDAARFEVAPKLAVIESAPLGRVDRLIVATPLLFTEPVPMAVPLEEKVTMPLVAATPPAATVAVRVTALVYVGLVVDALMVVVVASGATVNKTAADVEGV